LDFIHQFIVTPLGRVIATFIVAMLPVIELRGAIPLGVGLGLSHWASMAISCVGNLAPVPFIILFARRIFEWMKRRSSRLGAFASKLEQRAYSKRDVIKKWQTLGLVILVAIPLPGTGAWTGALVAAVLNMRLKRAFPAIVLGVLIAGVLVTGITYGFTTIFS
jgi:uncharacterized membrane protein